MSPYPTVVIVTTAHQNASGMDLKKLFSLPASAKYTADENRTTPLSTYERGYSGIYSASEGATAGGCRAGRETRLPHISIADSGHCYDGPPKRIGNRGKVGIGTIFISKEYCT